MTREESRDELARRLDAIIGLMVSQLISQNALGVGQIYKQLHDSGLTPSEIGIIVNRDAKDIGAVITMYEKRKNKDNNKNQPKEKKRD